MSINLAAVGLRVKPPEWRVRDARIVAFVGHRPVGQIEYLHALKEWRVSGGSSADYYTDSEAAKQRFIELYEQQVLAQLEAVEAVPTEAMKRALFTSLVNSNNEANVIKKVVAVAHKEAE